MALLLAVGLSAGTVFGSETIRDTKVGFEFTPPDGFVSNPEIAERVPNILHAFVRGDLSDDQLDLMLFVEDLGKPFKQEMLSTDKMPAGLRATHFQTKWQGLTLDGFTVPEQLGDINTLTINVQIPLLYSMTFRSWPG